LAECSTTPRVLIVEDDPLVALDLMSLLERSGFQVLGVAESGEQALVLARVRPVDVVVMDVDLHEGGGRLDGVQTAALIIETSTASVVFVTGEPPADVDRRCRAIGGARVVSKPWDNDALVDAVRHAI
jgi:DNA-binding NarL/FixJ family response regulator